MFSERDGEVRSECLVAAGVRGSSHQPLGPQEFKLSLGSTGSILRFLSGRRSEVKPYQNLRRRHLTGGMQKAELRGWEMA